MLILVGIIKVIIGTVVFVLHVQNADIAAEMGALYYPLVSVLIGVTIGSGIVNITDGVE